MSATAGEQSAAGVTRRIAVRLLPYLFLLYIIAVSGPREHQLCRSRDGAGSRIYRSRLRPGRGDLFIGYVVFEIPSALLVERWSARRVMGRILITWGVVTVLVSLVRTPGQFYAARFLLGAAEAGFFPGILVYLTHWFRYEDQAKAAALFMAAIPVANVVGSPLAGQILNVHWRGWQGWRWLFVLEGIPAVLFGVVTLYYLTDWPREAKWLSVEQRASVTRELTREREAKTHAGSCTILQAMRMPRVLLLTLVYFLAVAGIYGFVVCRRFSNAPRVFPM